MHSCAFLFSFISRTVMVHFFFWGIWFREGEREWWEKTRQAKEKRKELLD